MSVLTWSRKAIVPVAIVLFVQQVIGTISAIANRLPFENSTGHGDPNTVLKDFMTGGGTALSAPLIVLVILAVLIGLGRLQNRWGTLALIVTIVLGAIMTVFGLQEPLLGRMLQTSPFGMFEAVVVIVQLVGLLALVAIPVLSLLMVIGRARKK